jgi:hypothetical protein
MLEEWWRSDPSSRFFGFSKILFPARVETEGNRSLTRGGDEDREYKLILSSEPPLAKTKF